MKNYTALLQQLAAQLAEQQQQYADCWHKIIYTPFAPTLFSENGQSVEFYCQQMQQTLQQLHQLSAQDATQVAFFSEKLLAQAKALQDAVQLLGGKSRKTAVNFTAVLNKREQMRQQLEQLPPRERLSKYYEALQALNQKLDSQRAQLKQAAPEQKNSIQQQLETTAQRRQRCLDAIELLEEYLLFKQNNGQDGL